MKLSGRRIRQRLALLAVALLGLLTPLPSQSAPAETVEAFLARYYQAIPKAKTLLDLESWYTPMPPDPKLKSMLEEPGLMAFFMDALKGEPTAVKIVSKTVKGDRIYLELAPQAIPQRFLEASKQPGFSMTGAAILVADGDKWKVHKDFWTVKSTYKDGSETTTFGRNPPDGTAEAAGAGGASVPAEANRKN